jgi:hypothetical protein
MITLTENQLLDAEAKLAFVQILRQQLQERIAAQKSMLTAETVNETLAYTVVTQAMMDILAEHVDELAKSLGVGEDTEDKLAEVTDVLEGRRE